MPHDERRPFRMRERGKRNLHLFSQLDVMRQTFRCWRRIVHQRHGVVFGSFFVYRGLDFARLFLFALAHAVNRVIRRDAVNPGSKIRSGGKLSKLLVRAQESLLDHLFGIGPVPGHAISQSENIVAMPLDENAKSVAIARQRSLDGDSVALGDGLVVVDTRRHSDH